MAPKPRRYLPHGFQEKTTPDGRTYWINFRPLPPSWLPPADVRADNPKLFPESDLESISDVKESSVPEDIRLPKGVEKHYTPSGSVYYVDSRPRTSWVDPRTIDFNIDTEREEYIRNSTLLFTEGELPEPPPEAHIEFRLLMDLTKWRVAQSLSGYPDARVDEVDTLIEMLNSRISACPDLHKLKPMDGAFVRACYRHISSEADMASYGPSNKTNLAPSTPTYAWLVFKFIMYAVLLGVPRNYEHRLKKADWVQWSSRHRWTDQQRALDGFLKSLTNEWNLINLTAALLLSAAVGLLTVEGLSTISQTATLITLTMSLASLVMSVTFVWRYQRQLTNIHDLRKIMASIRIPRDEFIYESDADVMPIFLSLPVSFLLWSAIAFGTAILSHAWHTLPDAGPAIAIGTTAALGLSLTVSTVVWISHRRIESFKEWWQLGPTGWALIGSKSHSDRDVGLVHMHV